MNRRNIIKTTMALVAGGSVFETFATTSLRPNSLDTSLRIREVTTKVRPDIRKLKARLLANENPYGPSPKARLAMMENVRFGNRYGHGEAGDLISALAKLEGVDEKCILLGPGSSDLLEKTAIVKFRKGGEIVMADPSYMSLVNTAKYFGAEIRPVPLTSGYAHDLKAMRASLGSKTKLVYVCNPNNPTGSITDAGELKSFCREVAEQVPIFVDEAYIEFIENGRASSMVSLIHEGKDVIISRTFSKIHGMAGLRIGYIIAQPQAIEEITALSRPNMGMNVAALKAAIASIADEEFQKMSRDKNQACKEYLYEQLEAMGITYIPSSTSFVMFPLAIDGEQYLKDMFAHGVGVRLFDFDGAPWSRVSLGTMKEMKLFVQTLKSVLA